MFDDRDRPYLLFNINPEEVDKKDVASNILTWVREGQCLLYHVDDMLDLDTYSSTNLDDPNYVLANILEDVYFRFEQIAENILLLDNEADEQKGISERVTQHVEACKEFHQKYLKSKYAQSFANKHTQTSETE